MKILFDFQDMSGGAPRSQLSHMLVMKNAGHEVVATIGKDFDILQNKATDIKIFRVQNFNLRKPITNIKNIIKWLKLLRNENPEIIHSNRPTQYKMLSIVSDLSGIPLLFAQAGGNAKYAHIRPMKGRKAIVYSLENKRQLIKLGWDDIDIHLISNRLPNNSSVKKQSSKKVYEDCIKILLVGNISDNTINGLLNLLRLIRQTVSKINIPFIFQIAGNIVHSGKKYTEILENQIVSTNDYLNGIGKIEYLGWVDEIESIQAISDICIGKGRSILQPAMMSKICFVLAESGRLTRINKSNYLSLYEYNFSGRGDQSDDRDEFVKLFYDNNSYISFSEEARNVTQQIKDAYLIEFARHKLEKAYISVIKQQKRQHYFKHLIKAIKRFINIYIEILKYNKTAIE